MKIAAISKFRARLRNCLNQVKAGTEVLITDRGKPVARLIPISRTKAAGESLIWMEKQGLIKLVRQSPEEFLGHAQRRGPTRTRIESPSRRKRRRKMKFWEEGFSVLP